MGGEDRVVIEVAISNELRRLTDNGRWNISIRLLPPLISLLLSDKLGWIDLNQMGVWPRHKLESLVRVLVVGLEVWVESHIFGRNSRNYRVLNHRRALTRLKPPISLPLGYMVVFLGVLNLFFLRSLSLLACDESTSSICLRSYFVDSSYEVALSNWSMLASCRLSINLKATQRRTLKLARTALIYLRLAIMLSFTRALVPNNHMDLPNVLSSLIRGISST